MEVSGVMSSFYRQIERVGAGVCLAKRLIIAGMAACATPADPQVPSTLPERADK
jgi:hypothetical protein